MCINMGGSQPVEIRERKEKKEKKERERGGEERERERGRKGSWRSDGWNSLNQGVKS